MRNIKLTIAYDGTDYSGWQFQKNGRSIQETIEKAIEKITGHHSHLTGSGRTDAGVHAQAQIANFKTSSKIPLENIRMALNSALPDDIVIYGVEDAGKAFDSQRSAKSKLYRYTIMNADFLDPFIRRYFAKCFYRLNIARMRAGARFLVGRHDFKSFQAKDGERTSSIRRIKYIRIRKTGRLVYLDIEANGFLYNMARKIAGTLIEVGRRKIGPGDVKEILLKKDGSVSGPTMPAKGLCLMRVRY